MSKCPCSCDNIRSFLTLPQELFFSNRKLISYLRSSSELKLYLNNIFELVSAALGEPAAGLPLKSVHDRRLTWLHAIVLSSLFDGPGAGGDMKRNREIISQLTIMPLIYTVTNLYR